MASVRPRTRSDGSVKYQLMWREDGRQCSESFDTEAEAAQWKRLLDANGNSFTKAQQMVGESTMEGPTLAEMFALHIGL